MYECTACLRQTEGCKRLTFLSEEACWRQKKWANRQRALGKGASPRLNFRLTAFPMLRARDSVRVQAQTVSDLQTSLTILTLPSVAD